MSPIEKNCPTWACHHCIGESRSSIMQHIFHKGGCPTMRRQGYCPPILLSKSHVSLNNVFVLGQLDSSLWAGDQDGKWEGELSDASSSHRSFVLWGGMSLWPSIWRLTQDVSSTRLLDLPAMDTKLVAVNWNSRYSHLMWVQRPWQEIKQTTWSELTTSLSHCLGLHLYATNWAPSQMWGHLQPGRKVVTYLQEPPSLTN